MKTIRITISPEQLRAPGVSSTLADLIRCLGGTPVGRQPRRVAPAQAAPPNQSPQVAAPVIEGANNGANNGHGAGLAAAATAPKPLVERPVKTYREFYDSLPDRTRRFIDTLEKQGHLTQAQALDVLELKSPKAIGGVVGSLRRSAEHHGVNLPFVKATDLKDGRGWRWSAGVRRRRRPE